jgi:hypothetical protein
MLYYQIKIINPETKEIYFETKCRKGELPKRDVMEKFPGAILIINTTADGLEERKKAA